MLTDLFYHVDEFCKDLSKVTEEELRIEDSERKRKRNCRLQLSEVMTLVIYYHYSNYKTLKDYYQRHVLRNLTSEFSELVSYTRFIELKQEAALPLALFSRLTCSNPCTGVSFIGSFALKVCHNRRINSNRVFKDIAQRGKTSIGWFYGFKVHFLINVYGEIINFSITTGNVADSNPEVLDVLTQSVSGKVYGDKGYILNAERLESYCNKDVQFVTKVRKNMKSSPIDGVDILLLKKRGVIESCIGIMKGSLSIEHTRHRSPIGFLAHIFSSLIAYSFRPTKPTIVVDDALSVLTP